MRRLRLAILGESPCGRCHAACCRQNGHDYAVLLEGDERRKFAAFSQEVRIGSNGSTVIERVLPYREGRCVFLDTDDRCLIYEDRPVNCRRFQCVSGFNHGGRRIGEHDVFLQWNPRVREMLERL